MDDFDAEALFSYLVRGLIDHTNLIRDDTDFVDSVHQYRKIVSSLLEEEPGLLGRSRTVDAVLTKHGWTGERFSKSPDHRELSNNLYELLYEWKKCPERHYR